MQETGIVLGSSVGDSDGSHKGYKYGSLDGGASGEVNIFDDICYFIASSQIH